MDKEYVNKLKEFIRWYLEKEYSESNFLKTQSLEYWNQIYTEKYGNSMLDPKIIFKEIENDIKNKETAYEYKKMYEENHKSQEAPKEEVLEENIIDNTPRIISSEEIIKEEKIDETKPIEFPSTETIDLNYMFQDNSLENKITMTEEKPKGFNKKDNKGFAVLLSIVLTLLVGIGMVLVTMISYTLIK